MDENQHYALRAALFMLRDVEIDTEFGTVCVNQLCDTLSSRKGPKVYRTL